MADNDERRPMNRTPFENVAEAAEAAADQLYTITPRMFLPARMSS